MIVVATGGGQAHSSDARIVLAMLVRDEAGRVGRCLRSVRDVISSWVVIDTGSGDDTAAEVERSLEGVPGRLLHRPWVDFGHNRSELMVEAERGCDSGTWLLALDADQEIPDAPGLLSLLGVEADVVLLPFHGEPIVWTPRLLRAGKSWRYVGRTREYLASDEPFRRLRVDGPQVVDHADGASRADKWVRDIDLLRADLAIDAEDARRWFYLGESYRGAGQPAAAAAAYTNCAMLTKAPEEKYLALTMSGEMLAVAGEPTAAVERLLLADRERPVRREALLMACQLLNQLGDRGRVRGLLGRGDARRPLPATDVTGIVPGAYGELLVREQRHAYGNKG